MLSGDDVAQGPSVSIDTACSSSLVGAHLACSSFLGPSCPRALVTGVNLTLRAETTAVLAKAGMLAQVPAAMCQHCPQHHNRESRLRGRSIFMTPNLASALCWFPHVMNPLVAVSLLGSWVIPSVSASI